MLITIMMVMRQMMTSPHLMELLLVGKKKTR